MALNQNPNQRDVLTTDNLLVMSAANTFEINEYEVFTLAYEAWYGRPAEIKEIEPTYARYLLDGIVPAWVRSYCRNFVNMDTVKAFTVYANTEDKTGKFLRQLIMGLCVIISMLIVANTLEAKTPDNESTLHKSGIQTSVINKTKK